MRKYYLFEIKKEFYREYKNNSYALYKTLENLKKLKYKDLGYGLSLYEQICNVIKKERLNDYFNKNNKIINKENKHLIKKKKETTLIVINYSCILCYTNINIPIVLKNLKYYSSYLFVCDFKNRDFFFLNDEFNNIKNHEYNLI